MWQEKNHFGPFRLDLERGALLDGERELKVRKKVFSLLQLLLERRNQLVTYEHLQTNIWPDLGVDSTNIEHFRQTVRQHATELRKALGSFGLCITVTSGRGLKFSDTECTRIERKEGYALSARSNAVPPAIGGPGTSEIVARLSSEIQKNRGLYSSHEEADHLNDKARKQWDIRNPVTIRNSIRLFKLAAQCDPKYAIPFVGLAEAYIMAVAHGIMSPEVALPEARVAALEAYRINPEIGEPCASLAFISVSFDKDWIDAERYLKLALELSPEYAFTYNALGYVSITRGNLSRAVTALDRAMTFAPLSLPMRILQGDAYHLARETRRAVEICSDICKESPDSLLAHLCLGLACTQAGDHKQAIREHAIAVKLGKGNPQYKGFLGFALAAGGKIDEAKTILHELYRQSAKHYVSQYSLALPNIGIGEHNKALSHLEQGYSKHEHWLSFALVDPKLDALRGEKRFQRIISRFNPPPANVPGNVKS